MGNLQAPVIMFNPGISVWTDRCMSVICIILTIIILSHHLLTVYCGCDAFTKLNKMMMVNIYASILANILWYFVIWDSEIIRENDINSKSVWISALCLYCMNRGCIFLFGIIRLKIVFDIAPLNIKYCDHFLFKLSILVFINIILNCFIASSHLDIKSYIIIIIIIIGLFNSAFMILLYYLFSRKIKELNITFIQSISDNIKTDKLQYINNLIKMYISWRKLAILIINIISICPLIFLLLFSNISLFALVFDGFINCLCMVLSDNQYHKIYQIFFGFVPKKENGGKNMIKITIKNNKNDENDENDRNEDIDKGDDATNDAIQSHVDSMDII